MVPRDREIRDLYDLPNINRMCTINQVKIPSSFLTREYTSNVHDVRIVFYLGSLSHSNGSSVIRRSINIDLQEKK